MIHMTDIEINNDDKKKFLVHRYNDCAETLRLLKSHDFKVAALYIMIQTAVCAYCLFARGEFPKPEHAAKYIFIILDFALLVFSILVLFGTYLRQKELIGTIMTMNDLFDLNRFSSFVHAKPVNYVLEKPEGLFRIFAYFAKKHYFIRPIMMFVSFLCAFFSMQA